MAKSNQSKAGQVTRTRHPVDIVLPGRSLPPRPPQSNEPAPPTALESRLVSVNADAHNILARLEGVCDRALSERLQDGASGSGGIVAGADLSLGKIQVLNDILSEIDRKLSFISECVQKLETVV